MKPGATLALLIGAVLGLTAVLTAPAYAQATRTWISGVGDDVNPCSRTAPCKTIAGAISKTAAGGEIDCLDPGGFGAVTITKSINIDCASGETGAVGSVLVAGVSGIIVNAAATDVVSIRKLTIQGLLGNGSNSGNAGTNGIRFLAGKSLTVDNVNIMGFNTHGIDMATTATSKLYVINTNIMNCAGNGINVAAGGSGTLSIAVKGSRMYDSGNGVRVADNASATVHVSIDDSLASGNTGSGFVGTTGGGRLTMMLNRSTASNNGANGVNADGSNTEIDIGDNFIYGNGTGVSITNSAVMQSFKTNQITLNGTNISGTLSTGVTLQ